MLESRTFDLTQTLNELIKRRKRLTEMEVQYYLVQIVSALKYLHQNKVIHREYFFVKYSVSNLEICFLMKIWKSNSETSDWLLVSNMTEKKRKLFVVHLTISHLKFWKAKVILIKSMYGQSVSLFIHNSLENHLLKHQKLRQLIKELKHVNTHSLNT